MGLLEAAISECERENVDGEARGLWTCGPGELVSFVWDVGGGRKKNSTEGHQSAVFKANFMQFSKLI